MANRISVVIDVVADKATRGLQGFKKSVSEADGAVGKFKAGSASAFASLKANALPVAAAAGAALVTLGTKAVSAASRLEESMNAVDVSFGDAADGVHELGEASVESFGLSTAAFNEAAVQMSAFAKTVAGEGGDVAGTLEDLVGRATDFASVFNIDVEEALRLFQSGLAGETEPLRKFGKDLSAASVKAYALETGIVGVGEEMDEAAKVQARYGLLMEQTSDTSGDFANTQDSLANSTKTLNAQMENLYAALGEKLTPVVADAVQAINDLTAISEGAAGAANTLGIDLGIVGDAAKMAINPVGEYAGMLRDTARDAFSASGETQTLSDKLKENTSNTYDATNAYSEVTDALRETTDATDDASDATERTADVTRNAARAARDRRQAEEDLRDAVLESLNSDLAYRNSVADTAETVETMTGKLGDSSVAAGEQEQAVRDAESAILDQAAAAVVLAEDQAAANGETLDAKQKADIYKQELQRLAAQFPLMAPQIDGYIAKLNAIPRNVTTTVTTVFSGGTTNVPGANGYRAAGGPVLPGNSYIVGENGPEVLQMGQGSSGNVTNGSDTGGMDAGSFGREAAREFARVLERERRAS